MHTSGRWWQVVLAAGLLTLGAAGTAVAAKDEPADRGGQRASRDGEIRDVLKEIHNRGADLYNNGDVAGCYRMFQGALLMVRPMLRHHPKVQKRIDDGLSKADANPSMRGRAFALHELIENIRADMQPGGARAAADKTEDKKPAATLWDRLGGEAAVAKVIDDAVALMANDPKVDFTRGGKYKPKDQDVLRLKKALLDLISQATGGPRKYEGKSMKELHQGMGITDAQFDASVADVKRALEKNKVQPQAAQELLRLVEGTRKEIVKPRKPGAKKAGGTGRVSGTVTFKGLPLAAGEIRYVPQGDPKAKAHRGPIKDGAYDLKDLQPGSYRVAIEASPPKKDGVKVPSIPARYADPEKSGLVFEVKEGNQTLDIQLQP